MRRYYYPLEIFYFSFIEIWLKFRTSCQAEESAVKCLSFGHSKMARVGFERDHVDHNHSALISRLRGRPFHGLNKRQTNKSLFQLYVKRIIYKNRLRTIVEKQLFELQ